MMLRIIPTTSLRLLGGSRCFPCKPFINPQFKASFLSTKLVKFGRPSCSARFFSVSHWRFQESQPPEHNKAEKENIYTIPNVLTLSRILSCPILGWSIVDGNYYIASGLLVYAGLTDMLDGYLARRYRMSTVLGTILDPAADKALMTTLTITLTMQNLIPVPLAVIILGRDILLSLAALYIRYSSLPYPKTFARYWDFSLPSAEVRPTNISKVNTAIQLLLMGTTTVSPILPLDLTTPLLGLQWIVASTTIASGLSYVFSKDAVRVIKQRKRNNEP